METEARAALAAYGLADARLSTLSGGLINVTLLARTTRGAFVLQRLNPIFAPEVNDDLDAVTTHLASRGLATPRLVRTNDRDACVVQPDGVWRLTTFVQGLTTQRVDSLQVAFEAAALVARFHEAVADLTYDFKFRRAGVHDTAKHFALLDAAIDAHRDHAKHAEIATLRDELRAGLATLSPIEGQPLRITHGDLKISNVLFGDDAKGKCLVDLDTLGEMPLAFELGDAWRSWCNPLGEDTTETRFEIALFFASWRGYRSVRTPSDEERAVLVSGIATICLELSARFARDVLEDRYFGWDAKKFASREAHNLVRALGQANVYRSLAAQRAAVEEVVTS